MVDSIRSGNIKLVLCFAFYLLWWVVGFNTKHPIRGLKSGWLLIPAAILAILALLDIWSGLSFTNVPIPGIALIAGGAMAYVVLLAITYKVLRRPVTSELFIIVLWATVMLLEINTLFGLGSVSLRLAWTIVALCLVATAGSLVCYQLFYRLDARAAFIDGTIPLVLACIITGLITLCAK